MTYCSVRASSTHCHWYEGILQLFWCETCLFHVENQCTDNEERGTTTFLEYMFTSGRIMIEYSDNMIRGTVVGGVSFLLYYCIF